MSLLIFMEQVICLWLLVCFQLSNKNYSLALELDSVVSTSVCPITYIIYCYKYRVLYFVRYLLSFSYIMSVTV